MNTETQLIQACLEQKSGAFSALISQYQNAMYSVCLSILKNPQEAQEATQDTFIKMHRSLKSFNLDSKFSAWLYKIAYRTSLDYLRKRKASVSFDDVDYNIENNEIGQQESLHQTELSQQLLKAIAYLNPEEAGLIRMFHLEELTIKEMAEITGLSLSNVKVRLFRGRKKLTEIISTKFKDIESYLYE